MCLWSNQKQKIHTIAKAWCVTNTKQVIHFQRKVDNNITQKQLFPLGKKVDTFSNVHPDYKRKYQGFPTPLSSA